MLLINHLQQDSKVEIQKIPEEMLEDGLIDRRELIEICVDLIGAINSQVSPDIKNIFLDKLKTIVPIQDKKHYESLPLTSYNAFIEFGGLFSIYEVQKQNIIRDYDLLMELEGCSIYQGDISDSKFQSLSSVETDPSQQSILNGLNTKRNVVIQGPPGTGKSQSLTAVLVNALENHKKTIVVCEKRTALEVLENALNERGLHYNCVLIKDIVKDRKVVVDSVRDRIENPAYRRYHHRITKESLDQSVDLSTKLIAAINEKHGKLDQKLLGNKTWTELVGDLIKEKRKSTEDYLLNLDRGNFEFTTVELQDFLLLVEKGQQYWMAYAPYRDLSFLNSEKFSSSSFYRTEQQIKDDYDHYRRQLEKFNQEVTKYKLFYIEKRTEELKQQLELAKELKSLKKKMFYFLELIKQFKETYHQVKKKQVLENANQLDRSLDGILEFSRAHEAEKNFLDDQKTKSRLFKFHSYFSKKRKVLLRNQQQLNLLIRELQDISIHCNEFEPVTNASSLRENVRSCKELKLSLNLLRQDMTQLLEQKFSSINLLHAVESVFQNETSEELLRTGIELQGVVAIDHHQELLNAVQEHTARVLNACRDLEINARPTDALELLDQLDIDRVIQTHKEKISKEFHGYNLITGNMPYTSQYPQVLSKIADETAEKVKSDDWTNRRIKIDGHHQFQTTMDLILKESMDYFSSDQDLLLAEFNWFNYYNPLPDLYKHVLEELKPKKDWKRAFLIYYLNSLLLKFADATLPINDQEHYDLTASMASIGGEQMRYINEYWYSRQIDTAQHFETKNPNISVENLYNKRSSTRFKRLSLRQIVQLDLDLFSTYFPVILTTPDVCSNLFQGQNGYFDIVIFDEASQLRIEDNLPAILKGRQVIIAGDEHQMPPSNYFSKILDGSVEDEDDIEEEEKPKIDKEEILLSCESLLDFADELNFEKRYLDFHYRSRHPYLIDFSNYAFYNQRLCPLPNDFDYNPIKYIQVGGTFSEHTNEKEAEAVLSVLEHNINRMPHGKYPSVGIATFNINQRNLITSKINERKKIENFHEFNAKIQELEEDGLFIKNLENIQGDERDIIIISTTYGINKEGTFVQKVGPLTQAKGYKLLNVIVTRAKYKIYICTSVPESNFLNYRQHLMAEGANNKKAIFYAYLAYAKAVSEGNEELKQGVLSALAENTNAIKKTEIFADGLESPFEEEVYTALANVFGEDSLIPQMKFAGFRIDLVFDTKVTGKPRIAIECDGAKYHSSQEAYLHDLYRQKILEEHGFVFHRIWSTNWWRNTKRETEKLIGFIRNIQESAGLSHFKVKDISQSFTHQEPTLSEQSVIDVLETYSLQDILSMNDQPLIQSSLFGDVIQKGSLVEIKYLNSAKRIMVQLVSGKNPVNDNTNGYQKVSLDSPLGASLKGKLIGDIVKIGDLDNYVEVIKIKN